MAVFQWIKPILTFCVKYILWFCPWKGIKITVYCFMTDYFKKLVAGFNETNNEAVKNAIYNELVKFAEEADPHVVCYDMDLYVAIYKCALTPMQRKYALNHISGIIDDDYYGEDQILFNFEEFVIMKDFLHDDDVKQFDSLCKTVLNYFMDLFEESLRPKKHHVVPLNSELCKNELKRVVEIIKATRMEELESYKLACKIIS